TPAPAAAGRPAALVILASKAGFARVALTAGGPHRAVVMALPFTPEGLFARFDALGIAYRTYSHPPVFTGAVATALRGRLPGGHCKSLFLKDKNGGFWLAVLLEARR